jgi:DNA-binding transcriptional LysR family regulator
VAGALQQTQERLDELRGLKTGVLKLGAVSTAKYFAPSLLAAFKRAHPEVTIRFTVGNREEITRNLADHQSDLVIMGRPPRELDTVAQAFAKHPLVIVAAPSHPLAGRRRIPLERLESESFLIREQGSGTRAAMEQIFRERGASYRATMEVGSNETIKQAVIAGMGISFISAHTVGLELRAKRLVVLDVVGLPIAREWFVIHLTRKQLSPVAAAFRGLLLEGGARILATEVEQRGRR